ncbi:branched-chain amino acid ABC transporter permease [Actinomycetospora cinnamomea]|uniref:branched-chain amino acid ABC transporter permease n=1 Tax=Actinomycetospora cinnamomea TaxID=663609 RepID=UPI000E315646|nr:branched-chain amino acid ABC transporter permease [Actinomycetospora cinnamomea]
MRRPGTPLGRHLRGLVIGAVIVIALLELVSPFRVSQITTLSYYVVACAGLTLLTGINGQISLGHGALMAVGGYTTALLLPAGLPFLVAILTGAVAAGIVGIIVGAAAAKLHGPYLAGATLALAVGLPGLALAFADTLGGEQGLTVDVPRPPAWFADAHFFLFGSDPSTTQYLAYIGALVAGLVLFLLANLHTSRYGRVWRAVRDDEVAAELAGLRLGRLRVLAFVVSAVCAGLAGGVLALATRLVAPSGFTIVLSLSLIAAVVIGGLGSLTGAVLGSAVIVFLPPLVTGLGARAGLSDVQAAELAPLTYGLVLVLVMIFAADGAAGLVRRLGGRLRRRQGPGTGPPRSGHDAAQESDDAARRTS